ncbi:MAG: sigma-70 family RNA polymerase sigma factor [Patulibacter sp.]|nr:sigma-70 family RNA polymerase sigma factor [Patulibacter sp.]
MTPPPESVSGLADHLLVERVVGMDADAFEVLYDRHLSSAYALAYRIVGSSAPANDVCQEAFLAVWRSARTFDASVGSVRSWLLTIVRNRAVDYLRRVTRTKDHEVHDEALAERHAAPSDAGTEASALRSAEAGDTRELLEVLSPEQRRVIVLSFYSGSSHSEIAAMLDLPLGTVKARMNRGLAKLRSTISAGGAR